MSLITPIPQNSAIKVYSGIPWDNTLRDIRLFATTAERDTFLRSCQRGQWDKCSIVSIGKSIKVEGDYSTYLECNYLSFTNQTATGTARTIYAYITSITYVNVNTVQFDYEVDWIQTYLFNFEFDECMVEREHVNDDIQGRYVLEEGIDFGEYQVDMQQYMDFKPAVVFNILNEAYEAYTPDNMYIPGLTHVADINNNADITYMNEVLEAVNDKPERVSAMFMGVMNMQPNDPDDPKSTFFHETMQMTEIAGFMDSAASAVQYIPQNKKMLCYPYKFLTGDNYNGSVNQYRWEMFNNPGSADFAVEGSAMPKPAMQFFPIDYRKVKATSEQRNTYEQEGLWYENFPCVSYVSDTFKAWVSQYGTSFAVETAAKVTTGLAGAIASGVSGNPIGAFGGLAQTVGAGMDAYQSYKDHTLHSLQSHGGVSTAGLAYARGSVGFRITAYSVSVQDAMRIDKFLTRYGYRVESVKVPNVRGRQYVNFVKTNNATVSGNIAVDAKVQMERALDQGVSFWHTDAVGAPLTTNAIV